MADGKKTSRGQSGIHLLNIKTPKRTKERLKYSFLRVEATLTVLKTNRACDVKLTLVDVSEAGCSFFSSEQLGRGNLVELVVVEPKLLRLKGAIASCSAINTRMDSTQARLPYRCSVRFLYTNEAERVVVREFCLKLKENILSSYGKQVAQRPVAAVPENFVSAVAPSTEAAIMGPPEVPVAVVTPVETPAPAAAPTEVAAAAVTPPVEAAPEPVAEIKPAEATPVATTPEADPAKVAA